MHLWMNLLSISFVEETSTDPSTIEETTARSINMGPIHPFLKAPHHSPKNISHQIPPQFILSTRISSSLYEYLIESNLSSE